MTYILLGLSGASYLAAMALFIEITKKNVRRESIVFNLAGLVILMIVATSTGTAGVTTIWIDRLVYQDKQQETKTLTTKDDSLKSVPLYKDLLVKKVKDQFGDKFVSLSQQEARYIIIKKIDFEGVGGSSGLNKIARADCVQFFKDTEIDLIEYKPTNIRYQDLELGVEKSFKCDQIAMLERNRHIKLKH